MASVAEAPSEHRPAANVSGAAGAVLAAGLCNAAVTVSPHEDVRAYLQQTVLPVLGPAIEKLLHHIHESGELQRALYEDVRAYLRQTVLPVLGPAIEKLLHHIHESGELQRALRERAAAEHEQKRRTSERPEGGGGSSSNPKLKKSDTAQLSNESADSPKDHARRRPSIVVHHHGADDSPSSSMQTPTQDASPGTGDAPAAVEPPSFDPLVWLSEQLRQSALNPGDTSQYREQIEQLVLEQLSANEAGLEESIREEEASENAAAREESPPKEQVQAGPRRGWALLKGRD
eukprot:CAMPEP_0171147614 /NCGR_PEP_ID=MMETSP0766_2-20121228/148154_1 /TAXON_ID=439317 /ORGANISM="Gambierdiscus australes, Strain CAWD 149" /LENGTH=288 /DNA_ID=CAMNT_0011611523 /DNA_START=82 /DNA_END=949 /DNA_ORIENTATION=-